MNGGSELLRARYGSCSAHWRQCCQACGPVSALFVRDDISATTAKTSPSEPRAAYSTRRDGMGFSNSCALVDECTGGDVPAGLFPQLSRLERGNVARELIAHNSTQARAEQSSSSSSSFLPTPTSTTR